jgi:tyrosine-protein phosphatase SIW14
MALNRSDWASWAMGIAIAVGITVAPYVYYRMSYTHQKRFRVVTPGRFYRSGCMTASGLEKTLKTHGIRTVINLMEEAPDPDLPAHYFARRTVKESELCRKHGTRYVNIVVKYLPRNASRHEQPATIERYLEVMDDPNSYPVLIHCKAGLHRTGVLVGVYRMEYEGWTKHQALAEIRKNGFGDFASTSANDYIRQYILDYRPHRRPELIGERLPSTPGNLMSRPGPRPLSGFAPLPKAREP